MKKRNNRLKPLPDFRNEAEERDFWRTHDSAEYLDWDNGREVSFPNLKPTCRSVSVRLPISMVENLKTLANSMDIPYQSLMKVFLSDSISASFSGTGAILPGRGRPKSRLAAGKNGAITG